MKAVAVVTFLALTVFLSSLFGHFMLSEIEATDTIPDGKPTEIIQSGQQALTLMDGAAVFMMFGLFGIIMIRAFKTSIHPVFVVPGIIVLGIMGRYAAGLSNMMWEIVNYSPLTASANEFPLMITLIKDLPVVEMLVGGIVLVLMIGRAKA